MPDLVYLSLWLRDFSEQTMLAAWSRAIREFPSPDPSTAVLSLCMYPLDWGQPLLLEQPFPDGATAEQAVAQANECLHEDCAYEARLEWEIWVPQTGALEGGWERVQRIVTITCLGPAFEDGREPEDGHIQINFGDDSAFPPPGGVGLGWDSAGGANRGRAAAGESGAIAGL